MMALVTRDRVGGIQHLDLLMHLLHVVQEALRRVKLGVRAGRAGPVARPLCLSAPHDHQPLHHLSCHLPSMLALDHCTLTTTNQGLHSRQVLGGVDQPGRQCCSRL